LKPYHDQLFGNQHMDFLAIDQVLNTRAHFRCSRITGGLLARAFVPLRDAEKIVFT
jgi:hypothetical protein